MDTNLDDNQGVLNSRSGYLNHSQNERIEHGLETYYSGNLSISRREHEEYKEYSFTAHNSPQHCLPTSELNPTAASLTFQQPDNCMDLPNYMAKTESSRAKVRSQSEPKQRPNCGMRQKSKRMESTDHGRSGPVMMDNQIQRSSSPSKRFSHENYDPWFSKLYRPTRTSNSRSDAITTTSSDYNHYNSLAYEPHLTMY